MEEKSYIANENIVKSLSKDGYIPVYKGGSSGSGDIYDAQKAYIKLDNLIQTNTSFAPTVTDLVGGTFTVTNFLIDKVGDIVTFSFAGRFDLAAATTTGSCTIDLPTDFQPTANWSSQTDVNVVLHRTNEIFRAECSIYADDSGSKLLAIQVSDTTAEDSIRFSAVGRYKIS